MRWRYVPASRTKPSVFEFAGKPVTQQRLYENAKGSGENEVREARLRSRVERRPRTNESQSPPAHVPNLPPSPHVCRGGRWDGVGGGEEWQVGGSRWQEVKGSGEEVFNR